MAMATEFETDVQQTKHREDLYQELLDIRAQVKKDGDFPVFPFENIHDDFRNSAINLMHYLSLRRFDLRSIQDRLIGMGLSSLGGTESCVLSSLDKVLNIFDRLVGKTSSRDESGLDYLIGQLTLVHHTHLLLGQQRGDRVVRIMVTMPSEAAEDYTLIHRLLERGMDCMRINCAHDGPREWLSMIEHLRRAEKALNTSCRIAMDLGGPKLRTGPLKPGPEVIKVKPKRDAWGKVVSRARIWLSAKNDSKSAPSEADASLCVADAWLKELNVGDEVHFFDARNAHRHWCVAEVSCAGTWLEAEDTSYLTNGLPLVLSKNGRKTTLSGVPAAEQSILLRLGDIVLVTGDGTLGCPATYDSSGRVLSPAVVGCTLPECLNQVKQGESIWFDDGKIGGVIEQVKTHHIAVRITKVRAQGHKLRADKGINLPDSKLDIAAMTPKDQEDLTFVAQHADLVSMSFVNKVSDVEQLMAVLKAKGERRPGIILKIETRQGFVNLPHLLLSAMTWPSCGVMIARGDLAVECGFERMAEVQEEILWLCEAAHVPVIWATQVLETLAKEGLPSRAEISDAAMGHRAECVMLNKGPHVDMAVNVLSDILRRMQGHQNKRRAMMRRLQVAMF